MDFGQQQLSNLQTQLQQLQSLMNQPRPTPGQQPAASQKQICTVPMVDGLNGARQYLDTLGPNSSCAVFDKDDASFYLLSVDANGNYAPIKIGRFTLEDAPEPGSTSITKTDLDEFKAEIRGMIAAMTSKEETTE